GTVIADQAATEDAGFTYVIPADAFSDIDTNDSLTYKLTRGDGTALPSWLSFNASTLTLSGRPANNDVGNLDLKVTATDGAGTSATQTFVIAVANTNDAPIVGTAIPGQSATE